MKTDDTPKRCLDEPICLPPHFEHFSFGTTSSCMVGPKPLAQLLQVNPLVIVAARIVVAGVRLKSSTLLMLRRVVFCSDRCPGRNGG
jgi:hypothetical protein